MSGEPRGWLDETAERGAVYRYTVTALDRPATRASAPTRRGGSPVTVRVFRARAFRPGDIISTGAANPVIER